MYTTYVPSKFQNAHTLIKNKTKKKNHSIQWFLTIINIFFHIYRRACLLIAIDIDRLSKMNMLQIAHTLPIAYDSIVYAWFDLSRFDCLKSEFVYLKRQRILCVSERSCWCAKQQHKKIANILIRNHSLTHLLTNNKMKLCLHWINSIRSWTNVECTHRVNNRLYQCARSR